MQRLLTKLLQLWAVIYISWESSSEPPKESTSKSIIQQIITRIKKNYANAPNKKVDDFDVAFPMSNVLKSDDYQDYFNGPLGEGMLKKISKLFGSSHIKRCYHISPKSEAHNKVNTKNPPEGPLYHPFLPSSAWNAIDVGKDFDYKSRVDPEFVNAKIRAPLLYAYVMSDYSGQPNFWCHQK